MVQGRIRPPGDKSITHRALMLAALTRATVELKGALTAADAKSAARVLRQLGVDVTPMRRDRSVCVRGRPWRRPAATLDCGNSGTTARLTLGALAGHLFEARLSGDASLCSRPMRRVTRPLVDMGAVVTEEAGDCLPLSIRGGNLSSIRYESPVASAQVKSAILLAGLTGNVPVTVVEPIRSRDHTERMFQFLGFDLHVDGNEVIFHGAGGSWPWVDDFMLEIPGDASSAAFLVAAALLATEGELLIQHTGVNPTRTGFLAVLTRMGAMVTRENEGWVCGEPVADLLVRPSNLKGAEVSAEEIPGLIDEVPVLAVLAARAAGETIFRSVSELRLKESDRLTLIVRNLRAVGAVAEVQGEDLIVVGSDRPLSGRVETARDHRLTMAFAVAAVAAAQNIELSESRSAVISYPGFFQDLNRIMQRG